MSPKISQNLFAALCCALSLAACERAIQPGDDAPASVEPDTARSFVSAVISAPGMDNVLWEVRTPDTLSKGSIPTTGAYAGTIVRSYPVVKANIVCSSGDNPSASPSGIYAIYFSFQRVSNLSSKDFTNQNNIVDALRAWNEEEIGFDFIVPRVIVAPFVTDSIIYFGYFQRIWEEHYLPDGTRSNPNRWSVFALSLCPTYVNYMKSIDSTHPDYRLYSSKVERAWLSVDSYDLAKRRVSGRFSFRVIGSLSKEIIEIKDGKFENVRF